MPSKVENRGAGAELRARKKQKNPVEPKGPPAPVSSDKANVLMPEAGTAFKALLSARFCAAIWSHITDCDETFNYWEPLHYLMYGQGLQTWEYSPEYALRSYTYLLIHGVPAWIYQKLFAPNPMLVFYFIRCVLALACTTSEMYFYKATCREFGVHIGRLWLIFQLFSPGMFVSSIALLPSSFSMYLAMAALSAWWNQRYHLAVFFTAISALIGWPFAALIGLPIAYDMLVTRRLFKSFALWSTISLITVIVPMAVVDSSYFGKLVIAPVNLILYNLFTSHGPNLYGTEPFSYYLVNGFLNYNIVWLLALATPLFLLICYVAVPAKSKSTLVLPHYVSLAPLYLWLIVFWFQPHKEERFLFPIYPMIALCGAVSLDVVQKLFYRVKRLFCTIKPTENHYLDHSMTIAGIALIVTTILGMSRIVSLYRNYHAPLDTMMELSQLPRTEIAKTNQVLNVCMGKDWHRFPSSFFLPTKNFRVRFLKSEFKGMLPAYFDESDEGTKTVHNYFNDQNQENEFMYFNYTKCHFLFDVDLGEYTALEPNYASRAKDWVPLKTIKFLNAPKSHQLLRAFYIPWLSDKYVTYGDFHLLQKRRLKFSPKM